MKFQPHGYQQYVIDRLIDDLFVRDCQGLGLLLDPGLGKTAIVLRFLELLKHLGESWPTLVVAPLRVATSVWPCEIRKWQFDVDCMIVHGTRQRRCERLSRDADLWITTPDLVPWIKQVDLRRFELIVVDESTKFKSWQSKRSRALRKLICDIPKRMILTGTPSPDSLADLGAQMFVLDDGKALGRSQWHFRQRYMRQGGFENKEWFLRPGAADAIRRAVAPMVVRLDAVDHVELPTVLVNEIFVDLPPHVAVEYRALHRALVAELEGGVRLTASTAATAYGKLRQMAGGGVYQETDAGRVTHHLHDAKTDVVESLVEELSGKPALVFYQFQHDLERLRARFPQAVAIHGGMSAGASAEIIDAWNRDEIKVLLAQPQSMSHGLNLQASSGADIIWHGLPDSLETYIQANCRLNRQGQAARQLRIHHIIARGTVDEVIARRLRDKDMSQATLLDALREVPC